MFIIENDVSSPLNSASPPSAHILTDVVKKCDVPLLLSKACLKAAESQLDFVNNQITMTGRKIDMGGPIVKNFRSPISWGRV